MWFERSLKTSLENTLSRGKSIFLLGPRQSGKTSLVKMLPYTRYINLMDLQVAQQYQSDPGTFFKEMNFLAASHKSLPFVIIDEIQKVPSLTDYCQILIDEKKIQFLLTGSSARKIKNLLPGRLIKKTLSNLNSLEVDFASFGLESIVCNGSLPGILSLLDPTHIDEELGSYVALYLEDEIRKEALVRNLTAFQHFLKLACIESGQLTNFS